LLLGGGLSPNDLYMMLGNEAWPTRANPTIQHRHGDKTLRQHRYRALCFQRRSSASLLEQELALLRGRDDQLQPGVTLNRGVNRLYWNYTRGHQCGGGHLRAELQHSGPERRRRSERRRHAAFM